MFTVVSVSSGCTRGRSVSPSSPPTLGKPWTVPGVDLEMVWLSSGTFLMGSMHREAERDEAPVHRITISRGFWMGKYEVTQLQWKRIMCTRPSYYRGWTLPVECVTWFDAKEFCRTLNRDELTKKSLPDEYQYRLPTEAEWEYACRGGLTTDFCKGDLVALGFEGWFRPDDEAIGTHPVGLKNPNPWGLHDMRGNVAEWCEDFYGKYDGSNVTDPQGPTKGGNRVLRGGSHYVWSAWEPRASCRSQMPSDSKGMDMGFRIVAAHRLDLPERTTNNVTSSIHRSCAVNRVGGDN